MKPLALFTKFQPPYIKGKSGLYKSNFPQLKEKGSQAGVYIIKSKETGDLLYIGSSRTQLYKTLYRHFEQWNDKQQERYVYDKHKYLVRIIYTTPERAAYLEAYLINKYQPRDNAIKYEESINDQIKSYNILDHSKEIKPDDPLPF